MSQQFTDSEAILAQFAKCKLSDANEASTRLKVIDAVLYQVLGWTHDDINPEERVSEDGKTTWSDYVVKTGMTAFVVEAKKVGASFENVPATRRVALRGRIMDGELGQAIIQARDYARKSGIPFAIVTNGDAWIIFPATRVDQISFANSSAVIFPNIQSVLKEDFAEFVDLLSRHSVINGSLENDLLGRIENQLESRRLISFYPSGFSKINRHSIYPLISDAINTAFSEDVVNSDPSLLDKMYVRTPDRARFDTRVRINIQRRGAVTAKASLKGMRERADREVKLLIESAYRRAKPLAMLVLGQVGSGKTTFLQYTRHVSAKDIFEERRDRPYPHWFYIDFRSFAPGENPLNFLIEAVFELIAKDAFLSDYDRCIKHAYHDEIEALFRGPLALMAGDEGERRRQISDLLVQDYKQKKPYVEKVLAYAAQNAGIFLVVDNIDQIEKAEVQSEVFSNAMAFSRKVGTNLVCAMRESTYVRHKVDPIFDAFDFDPITIEPPLIEAVLSRRFLVAREILSGEKGAFTAENGAHVQVDDLSQIIDLVQASVLGTSIGSLIEVLSTSDVRLALRMTREFLQSGWTASGKALRIFQETGRYIMPAHEALRAILIGNQQQYYEQHSVVANPFDSRISKTEAQLLRLYVLSAVVQMSSDASFRSIDGEEIRLRLRELGFGDAITLRILEDLCSARFLHTEGHGKPSFETGFVVSRLGGYIVRVFPADMMFLENVMMDTFIADQEIWETLKSLTQNIYSERNTIRKLSVRRERSRIFFSYMSTLYRPLRDESIRRGFAPAWCSNPFDALANQLETNLNKISRSAERNYGESSQSRG